MAEIIVELVKYDTEKTTKRKRSNLVVEAKSEAAIISKLERIHKGDKVKVIHEVIWGEEKVSPKAIDKSEVFTGTVKFFEKEKGFGFIQPEKDMADLFFHESALGGEKIYDEDFVEFQIGEGNKGPVAIHIKLIED